MAETSSLGESAPHFWPLLVRRIIAALIGAVFLYAGVTKTLDPLEFARAISHYQIIPWSLGVRFAFYLPWLEILCGLGLIFHRLFFGALAITTALMLLFVGATLWARARGINIACGCFGTAGSNLTLTWHLVIDFCILAALAALWWMSSRKRDRHAPENFT
ncbi:MAG TPA: MauE/DoxX family redox-associated membrane protein [Chthoniobacterales bacterium]|jgi:hypothetical protein|nr:MauE/DoxX family redox-associated membrane protein [Chthoniobacterales bacterium]